MQIPSSRQFGRFLIACGIIGFFAAIVLSFTIYSGTDRGAIAAISFFFVMIGMCFYFPTLLQETGGQVSTMRVVVFAVVMVFCVIELKIGWTSGSFENFSIDPTWVYILGIAFGSKAIQKFAEEDDNPTNNTPPNQPPDKKMP
jgi:hypothetical protein